MAAPTFRYFANAFFSPYYFPTLVAPDGGGTVAASYGDQDAFDAMIAALEATGEFADVLFGVAPDQRVTPSDAYPIVLVMPESWTEANESCPGLLIRQVEFSVTLIVRDDSPLTRFARIERLTAVIQDALNGSDLGGGSFSAMTLLNRGRFDPASKPPELSVVLRGEFAYLIPTPNGHLLNQI